MGDKKPAVEQQSFQVLSIVAALGFWIWALVAGQPLAFLFAVLWTAVAAGSIWRLTHGGEPIVKRRG